MIFHTRSFAFAADRRGNFAGKTGKTTEKEWNCYELFIL